MFSEAESEELFRVVFDSSCDAILLHTPEGAVFKANATFWKMYGGRPEDLSSITIEKISSRTMSMDHAHEIWRKVLSGEQQSFEWKARRLDNREDFDVEVFLRRIRLGGREVILASISDVSTRKKAEAVLMEQTHLAKLRADAIHALQQPLAEQDLLQALTGLLVSGFDAAFARIWTLAPEEQVLVLQASAGLYKHLDGPHSRVPLGQLKIGRIAQERRPHITNQVVGDSQIPAQDWARREGLVAFAGMPLISEGALLGVVALFARHPLSPASIQTFESIAGALAQALGRKQAEAALRATREALARANAELEQKVQERTARLEETVADLEHFSYTLTHDMRAPLRAMQGLGGFLVDECADCKEPARREYIRRISAAAARMDKLITDALQYGAIVRQRYPMAMINTDDVLRGILETYPEFHSQVGRIVISEPLPVVFGNEAALTQCFSNLLGNAIKFTRPGRLPEIRIWWEDRGRFVRLWIADQGIGIPVEHQEKIWAMFQKLDRKSEGTGIGLTLVRKAVERMGGSVGVESEAGKGARFWVELQARQPEVVAERPAKP